MIESRAVVITGLGPISAIGIGREDFHAGILGGREGCREPQRLQGDWPVLPQLAECLDFVVEDYLESEKTYLDRCSEFLLASCALALEDAGLDWRELDHPRFGLSVGTAFGCLDSMHNVTARVQAKGLRFASPMIFTHSFANSPASLAAIEYKIEGPVSTVTAGGTSGAEALRYGLDLVRRGRAEVVLAGGVDVLSEALLAALNSAGGLSDEAVPGEGACLFLLESAEHAADRGAKVHAELAGVGLGGYGQEDVDTALRAACLDAGIEPVEPWEAPTSYGYAFGASLSLDLAAALSEQSEQPRLVETLDLPSGRRAAVVIRSLS